MATKRAKGAKKKVSALAKAATAAQKRAEELLLLIARRKARIAEDFYDIGAALAELKKKKLYAALGYASFAAMLTARKVMSARTADKLIEIVGATEREQAIDLGQEKAYALARLVAATPALDTVDEVVAKGAVVRGKRVAVKGKSVRELTALAGEARPKKVDPEAKAAARDAKALQARLRARGAKGATVTSEKRGGAAGWWVRIELRAGDVGRVIAG
jgi:hypothetical protein